MPSPPAGGAAAGRHRRLSRGAQRAGSLSSASCSTAGRRSGGTEEIERLTQQLKEARAAAEEATSRVAAAEEAAERAAEAAAADRAARLEAERDAAEAMRRAEQDRAALVMARTELEAEKAQAAELRDAVSALREAYGEASDALETGQGVAVRSRRAAAAAAPPGLRGRGDRERQQGGALAADQRAFDAERQADEARAAATARQSGPPTPRARSRRCRRV